MGTFNDPNQFAFFIFTMMLVLFMGDRRKAIYTAKTRIGFWGMFLLGVFLIGKGKINGDVCRSACILLCAYRTAFLGQMLPFKAEKAVVDRRRGFCGAVGCWGI